MDFKQRKLIKSEWDAMEIPLPTEEQAVLSMIIQGYHNVEIHVNLHLSLLAYLKIQPDAAIETYLYNQYFHETITRIIKTHELAINMTANALVKLKSVDKIRLERIDKDKINGNDHVYEFLLIKQAQQLCEKISMEREFMYYYYSLHHLIKNHIVGLNKFVIQFIVALLEKYRAYAYNYARIIIKNAAYIIEQNANLLHYSDLTLYSHQKDIFNVFSKDAGRPKLVLYMAPTGTGKTMTPLALSEEYRVIFVCAARHVGLALARAAITMHKKVAFAFGCETAADIRLHNSAAAAYEKKEMGGPPTRRHKYKPKERVDNSVGTKVEIMICDMKSYVPAMHYMISFNARESIITYWDEPTISMDYASHEIHELIQTNWSQNVVPNMVLSSATLPRAGEIQTAIDDFMRKFPNAVIKEIHSYDCRKSIPLVDSTGRIVLPHYLCSNYEDVVKMAVYCEANLTLLRYFDLQGVANFIIYCQPFLADERLSLENIDAFDTLDKMTMNNIKCYYLSLLQNLQPDAWPKIYDHFMSCREVYIKENVAVDNFGNRSSSVDGCGPRPCVGAPLARTVSLPIQGDVGVYVTTKDAYTLTDGPTIFITNDTKRLAQFCIQQANIPENIMADLKANIVFNNGLLQRIDVLNKSIEDSESEVILKGKALSDKDCHKFNRSFTLEELDTKKRTAAHKVLDEINSIRGNMKSIHLNNIFIPNKTEHLQRWVGADADPSAFTSDIDETVVNQIMSIVGVDDCWKILLLMGIGVFMATDNAAFNTNYMEIMKWLATEQKLYLIIASSDYIYGTNYQLCHGYLSKDLTDTMTQEKIVQALGRIGRGNVQQSYSARFRDDRLFMRLFTREFNKPEVANMSRLFQTREEDWCDDDVTPLT